MKVYLAGPITGLTYKGATEWREAFADDLKALGHVGVSPMRGKDYLRELFAERELVKDPSTGYGYNKGDLNATIDKAYEQFPMSGEQGIFGRDTFDVANCDVTLANFLGAEQVSIGTVMEVMYAFANRRFVMTVMKDGCVHDHPFIRRASSIVVPDLDVALQVCGAFGSVYVEPQFAAHVAVLEDKKLEALSC